MAETFEPPIAIAPDGAEQALMFNTLADAKSFVERERQFWDFLLEKTKDVPNTTARQQARFPMDRMEHLRTVLSQFEGGSIDRDGVAREFHETFVRNNRKIPISYHPNAQAIAGLAKTLSPEAFIVAAVQLNGRLSTVDLPITFRDEATLMGIVAAMNVRLGNSPSALEGAATGFDHLRQTYAALLTTERSKLQQEHEDWQRTRGEAEARANQLLEDKGKAADDLRDKHSQAINEANTRIKALENTYNEKLRVAASTKYWGDKRAKHRRRAKQWGGIAILYALMATGFMWWGVNQEYETILTLAKNPSGAPETPLAAYLALAARGLVVAIVVFWVGRVVVRMYLSELHLGMDAYERSTMVETYLALTQEGKISDEERKLVLMPLFRPTADGLVKDDAHADTNLASLVGKLGPK